MNICEIFYSIQGETTYAGLPCVFVRTSGCNLRCLYCDTKYAYEDGVQMSVDEALAQARSYGCRLIEITGGEPLVQQEEVNSLIASLLESGNTVLLETNGSVSIESVDRRVVKILDLKCPDSGMSEHMDWENIQHLSRHDQVKFVLSSRRDYEWVREVMAKYPVLNELEALLSVAFGALEARDVVKWMLDDRLNVRFQLQIHKHIWHPEARGV
ncbi:radical SAM protein [Candidatus Poribacteria bacterium]